MNAQTRRQAQAATDRAVFPRNQWYVIAWSRDIGTEAFARTICGEPILLYRKGDGTLAAMRLVGLMAEEWQTIGMARRARGVGARGSLGQRVKATLGQSFGLLVQAIRRASRLAVTMEARGFGGGRRTASQQQHPQPQALHLPADRCR